MSKTYIAAVLMLAVICLVGTILGEAQQVNPAPKTPVDLSQVRMHFTGARLVIYAPSDRLTMRPGMDKSITVIEIDTTPPIVPGK